MQYALDGLPNALVNRDHLVGGAGQRPQHQESLLPD